MSGIFFFVFHTISVKSYFHKLLYTISSNFAEEFLDGLLFQTSKRQFNLRLHLQHIDNHQEHIWTSLEGGGGGVSRPRDL